MARVGVQCRCTRGEATDILHNSDTKSKLSAVGTLPKQISGKCHKCAYKIVMTELEKKGTVDAGAAVLKVVSDASKKCKPLAPANSVSSSVSLDKKLSAIGQGTDARKKFEVAFSKDVAKLIGSACAALKKAGAAAHKKGTTLGKVYQGCDSIIDLKRVVVDDVIKGSKSGAGVEVSYLVLSGASGLAVPAEAVVSAFKSKGVNLESAGTKTVVAVTAKNVLLEHGSCKQAVAACKNDAKCWSIMVFGGASTNFKGNVDKCTANALCSAALRCLDKPSGVGPTKQLDKKCFTARKDCNNNPGCKQLKKKGNVPACKENSLCKTVMDCTPCAADFNDDRVVAINDLMDVLGSWQKSCKIVGGFSKASIGSRCMQRTKCFDYTVSPERFLGNVKGCKGGSVACAPDIDKSGKVDVSDLMLLLSSWNEKCGTCASELAGMGGGQ